MGWGVGGWGSEGGMRGWMEPGFGMPVIGGACDADLEQCRVPAQRQLWQCYKVARAYVAQVWVCLSVSQEQAEPQCGCTMSSAFTSAPFSTRNLTVWKWPLWAARISGVSPICTDYRVRLCSGFAGKAAGIWSGQSLSRKRSKWARVVTQTRRGQGHTYHIALLDVSAL